MIIKVSVDHSSSKNQGQWALIIKQTVVLGFRMLNAGLLLLDLHKMWSNELFVGGLDRAFLVLIHSFSIFIDNKEYKNTKTARRGNKYNYAK